MALSPKDLNKWTPEDEAAVREMENHADNLLSEKKVACQNGEFRIMFEVRLFKTALSTNANLRLNTLMNHYRNAGWGEVDGGITGNGSAVMSLREHKRYYQDHH